MKTLLRCFAAVLAGLFVLFVLVVAVEVFGAVVHPVPEDFGGTTEEMCRHVERYPHWVLAVVVPMWAAAALAGTWTAQKLGNVYCSAIVGLLLLAALVFNVSMLPYPVWFKAANLLVIPAAVLAGSRLATRGKAAAAGDELNPAE
jgi:hypothetical protein